MESLAPSSTRQYSTFRQIALLNQQLIFSEQQNAYVNHNEDLTSADMEQGCGQLDLSFENDNNDVQDNINDNNTANSTSSQSEMLENEDIVMHSDLNFDASNVTFGRLKRRSPFIKPDVFIDFLTKFREKDSTLTQLNTLERNILSSLQGISIKLKRVKSLWKINEQKIFE